MGLSRRVGVGVSHNNLIGRDSLDSHPISSITALDGRLSTDESRLTSVENNKVNTSTYTAGLLGKADTEYVNTALSSILNGSPKGTYASPAALTAAHPTGDTGIYIVTNDGNWYFWNGAAWTAGGVYQATTIGANTVTDSMLATIGVKSSSENLSKTLFKNLNGFVKTETISIESGKVWDTLLGTDIVSGSGRRVSFTIPVGVSKVFLTGRSITANVGLYCLVDASNNVIASYATVGTNTDISYFEVDIPANASKILINSNQFGNVISVESFNVLPSSKLFNVMDNTSFTLNKFDNAGTVGNESTLSNTWACAQQLLSVGNTKTLYVYHTSQYNLKFIFYKYDSAEAGIALSAIYNIKPNTLYSFDMTGLYYIRSSFQLLDSGETPHVIDFTSFDLIMSLDNTNVTTSITNSLQFESVPRTDFGVNKTVGASGCDYTNIGTAYNATGRVGALSIMNGVYDGYLSLDKAFLFGKDRDTTIIRNTAAQYPYSALSCVEGILSDLSFYATNANGTNPTYSIHLENDETANKYLKFRNCRFISDYHAAVGIGMRVGFVLEFENCEFITNTTGDNAGAVFFHDSISADYLGLQYIIFKKCTFVSAGNNALRIQSVNPLNTLIATFIDCNLYSKVYGNKNVIRIMGGATDGFLCGNSVLLSKRSKGNNIDLLNAS